MALESDGKQVERSRNGTKRLKIVQKAFSHFFVYLAAAGQVSSHDFLTVFSVVIAFYFGTQSERLHEQGETGAAPKP